MARAIDADEFERFLMNLPDEVLCEDCCYVVVNEMRKQPTIDTVKHGYVPIEVVKQIQWERDIAIEQLNSYGVQLVEKAELKRVRHGEWNLVSRKNIWDDLVDVFECSECKKYTTNGRGNTSQTDYCPNCGARMNGEKSSRD